MPPGGVKTKVQKEGAAKDKTDPVAVAMQAMAGGASPADVTPLLLMAMMTQQQEGKKARNKPHGIFDYENGEDSDENDPSQGTGGMRAVNDLNKMNRRLKTNAAGIMKDFESECARDLGIVPGQPWTLLDWAKKTSWGKFRGLYRCIVMDIGAYELLRKGSVVEGTAKLVQNMKAKVQATLQLGSSGMQPGSSPAWRILSRERSSPGRLRRCGW
jgi:hypothetical protein